MSRRVLLAAGCLTVLLASMVWFGVHTTRTTTGEAALAALTNTESRQSQHPLDQFNTERLTVPREQILSGGPGKDGIPALTIPQLVHVRDTAFLRDIDRMVVLKIADDVRAYPLSILNWHEVVNDVVGDTPIAVIYCPLCDSVTVVDRRIGDKTLEFGVSGLLLNSNVLFYDRTENALWSQAGLVAISGPHAGRSLKHLPWRITTAAALRQEFPHAQVIGTDTGYQRDYTRNPYASYFTNDRLMFPVASEDKRLGPKARIIGIRNGNTARGYPVDLIMSLPYRKLTDTLENKQVTLIADAQGGVRVVELPEDAQVIHTFWFAWAAFHPKTELYVPSPAQQPRAKDAVAPPQ